MSATTVKIPDTLLSTLRRLKRAEESSGERCELTEAVAELLELATDEPGRLCEYGYRVTLSGIARVTDRTKADAMLALAEFQDVDTHVPYGDKVTVTELSIVMDDNLTLVDIDGIPLGTNR